MDLLNFCLKYFKTGTLESCEPLSGGAVNETFKIKWEGTFYVLRLYKRDAELAQVEKSVYALVQGKIDIPKLYYLETSDSPFAIFEFIDKKHIYEVEDKYRDRLSYDLGRNLAEIHKFSFPQAGLFGKNFEITIPFEKGSSPYFEYIVEHFTKDSLAAKRMGFSKEEKLRQFLDKHHDSFPVIRKGGRLVHSDFKPVNLLWDEKRGLTVLDWEFAHSGDPLMDFGILLRHKDDFPLSISYLEKGYSENGGSLPSDWVRKAQITDLINLIQLLNSSNERPVLFEKLVHTIDNIIS